MPQKAPSFPRARHSWRRRVLHPWAPMSPSAVASQCNFCDVGLNVLVDIGPWKIGLFIEAWKWSCPCNWEGTPFAATWLVAALCCAMYDPKNIWKEWGVEIFGAPEAWWFGLSTVTACYGWPWCNLRYGGTAGAWRFSMDSRTCCMTCCMTRGRWFCDSQTGPKQNALAKSMR